MSRHTLRALTAVLAALAALLIASGSGAAPIAAPTVSGFSPAGGVAGSTVQINGSGFTGVTAVRIGGVSASFVVDNDATIHATVPNVPDNAAATRALVKVYISPGVFGVSPTEFLVLKTPSITGFNPAQGAVGSAVEIRGKNLNLITGATLNGHAIALTDSGNGYRVHATISAGASTGKLTVTNAAGTSAPSAKSYKVSPTVTGFSPGSGPKSSTIVQIDGLNFTGATKVRFGGKDGGHFTVDSDTMIHATVPPKALTGKITVTTPSGSGVSAGTYTVTPTFVLGF